MSDEHEHDPTFTLVVPFVVCESQGGPFQDISFTAGYRCGVIDAALGLDRCPSKVTVHEPELPQLDLIAMRHGYTMTSEQADGEWHFATFTKQEPE